MDIIDPADRHLSLNPFAVTDRSEASETGVLNLLTFIIGGLLNAEMTPKQRGLLRGLARTLTQIPGATLLMMRDILSGTVRVDTETLKPELKIFWEKDYLNVKTLLIPLVRYGGACRRCSTRAGHSSASFPDRRTTTTTLRS